MIARAGLTNQILENPIKNRVTACRKRLRNHRSVGRTGRHDTVSSPEQCETMAQFPADSLQVRQLVSFELSPAFDDKTAESLVQEVGIT